MAHSKEPDRNQNGKAPTGSALGFEATFRATDGKLQFILPGVLKVPLIGNLDRQIDAVAAPAHTRFHHAIRLTDRIVNVGSFAGPQRESLELHRTNVFLTKGAAV